MSKVKGYLRILRYLHKSIYFNFKCLPIQQAIKLPILLYKPKFGKLDGRVTITPPHKNRYDKYGVPYKPYVSQ